GRVVVEEPADLLVGECPAVPLGPDDVDGVHRRAPPPPRVEGKGVSTAPARAAPPPPGAGPRPEPGPSAPLPPRLAVRPPRERPHGMTGRPSPTASTATSLPPPLASSALTSPHSAHSVSPYDAFSTLQPVSIRPSSVRPAAPTWKFEYGAYAWPAASRAAARS